MFTYTSLSIPILSHTTLFYFSISTGVPVRPEAPPSELAVAVARHFESMEVDEETVLSAFLARLSAGKEIGPLLPPPSVHGGSRSSSSYMTPSPGTTTLSVLAAAAAAEYARETAQFDGTAPGPDIRRRRRSKHAARPAEQVAAKITRTDENGSWILASVQRFYGDTETYDVQDEDDESKLIRLPWNHVMRLSTGSEGGLEKHTRVMAIFPETTSFYRAVVSQTPVWVLPKHAKSPLVKEVILKFEDDEGSDGRTPHRRVPSRYVIPLPEAYFHEDEDDVDLTSPTVSGVGV